MKPWWPVALVTLAGCHALLDIDGIDYGDPAAGGSSTAGSGGEPTGGGGTGGGTGAAGGGGAAAQWYDSSFGYRRKLSIDNADGAEPLTDVPLLVVLDSTRIDYAHVEADGRDVRFVDDDDATVLDHEIELWAATGTSYVWVKVPSIPANDSTRFVWMYYGNPTAADGQNAPGTWSNGYQAVWHLGVTLEDSTGNGHDGTNSDTQATAGTVGQARQFDGATSYIDISSPAALETLFGSGGAVSAWVRPNSFGEGSYGRIVDMSTALNFSNGWGLVTDGGSTAQQALSFARDFADNFAVWATPPGSVSLGDWQHVAVTYDEDGTSDPSLYLDGMSQTVVVLDAPQGAPQSTAGSPLRVGNRASSQDRSLDGSLDELRLSSSPRSAAWIGAQYRSMTDVMISYGVEETQP